MIIAEPTTVGVIVDSQPKDIRILNSNAQSYDIAESRPDPLTDSYICTVAQEDYLIDIYKRTHGLFKTCEYVAFIKYEEV